MTIHKYIRAGAFWKAQFQYIIFNDDLEKIEKHGISGMENLEKLNLPSNLKSMEGSQLDSWYKTTFPSLEEINISDNYSQYSSDDGVVYSKDGKELMFYPYGKKDKEYVVPDGVEKIQKAPISWSEEANYSKLLKIK